MPLLPEVALDARDKTSRILQHRFCRGPVGSESHLIIAVQARSGRRVAVMPGGDWRRRKKAPGPVLSRYRGLVSAATDA